MPPSISIPGGNGMFHTFQGVTPRKPPAASQYSSKNYSSGNKRITTPHACAECKRRKIRCDGKQPCSQCLSSRAPKRCFYDKHRQRVIPSRKTLETLSQSLEECRSILRRLYPDHDTSDLLPLSRGELLSLLGSSTEASTALPSPPINTSPLISDRSARIDESLALFERFSKERPGRDEDRCGGGPAPIDADDVNYLSHGVDRQTSFLGASSIKAALLVMLKVQPHLKDLISPSSDQLETAAIMPNLPQRTASPEENCRVSWSWKGQTLIDVYFKRVHTFVPMLDEPAFRTDYLEGKRCDSPWMSLLNMVFAMGSIAAMKSDDQSHIEYYHKAMEHLSLDSLGSAQIETVQALALIGGYYLHYVNRPSMANAVLGAALRMASTLGLYRKPQGQGLGESVSEARRRTWLSLFCLDAWSTTTLGLPGLSRCYTPEVNIHSPQVGVDKDHESGSNFGFLPLVENVKFCRISSKVQDILAVAPLLKPEDRRSLDNQLVSWYNELPWALRSTDPCAEPLYLSRCIMKWRYQNLRMLLHRPILLSIATKDDSILSDRQDLKAVDTCREIAKATIDDISREWASNQMSGWNAAWFLYQAVMVPLVSLHWQWNSHLVPSWQIQIETVLDLLDAMKDWSLAASRSREVVSRLYEARRQSFDQSPQSSDGTCLTLGDIDLQLSSIELCSKEMMDMLEEDGIWDTDGMCWGQSTDLLSNSDLYSISNDSTAHMGHVPISFDASNAETVFLVQE